MTVDIKSPSLKRQITGSTVLNPEVLKRRIYVETVGQEIAEQLAYMDPASHVLISGSYAKDKIRYGSDLDMIVFSEQLKEPMEYYKFLLGLKTQNRDYAVDTGNIPFLFTQVAREEAMRYIYIQHLMATDPSFDPRPKLLPVHLLFYFSSQHMIDREPSFLAQRLLTHAQSLNGDRVEIPQTRQVDQFETALDNARWVIERALAELVLNYGHFPLEYLALEYKSLIYTAVRSQIGDTLMGLESDANVETILQYLGRPNLVTAMKPVCEIHQVGVRRQYSLEELAQPALLLLNEIDKIIREQKTVKSQESIVLVDRTRSTVQFSAVTAVSRVGSDRK